MAHAKGEHVWHTRNADEFFLVMAGQVEVVMREADGTETAVSLRQHHLPDRHARWAPPPTCKRRVGQSSRGSGPGRACATGMLGAVISRNGKGGYRLEDGAADAIAMGLPLSPLRTGQPTSGGTDGPQVTCAPAGTSAQSIHGPTYWGLCRSKAGSGPALITNLAPWGMAEGVMV